jgi:hypothetical protein
MLTLTLIANAGLVITTVIIHSLKPSDLRARGLKIVSHFNGTYTLLATLLRTGTMCKVFPCYIVYVLYI